MSNNKWYILVDIVQAKAVEYLQLPKTWRDLEGMWDLSDSQLLNLYEWSEYKNSSLISLDEAIRLGIDGTSIQLALSEARPKVVGWLRTMRDVLLAKSDIATSMDRWVDFDTVSQRRITTYRQALRDLTEGDVTDVQWPSIPKELDFIRAVSTASIARPSIEFLNCLSKYVADPIDTIRADMAERIKAERERRKSGGVSIVVDGLTYWFWTDEPTRNQYSLLDSMVRRNNLPDTYVIDDWKTMNGTFVPMTVGLLHQVIDTGIQKEQILFKIATNHLAAMEASEDPATYNYMSNWPTTYLDYVAAKAAGLGIARDTEQAQLD